MIHYITFALAFGLLCVVARWAANRGKERVTHEVVILTVLCALVISPIVYEFSGNPNTVVVSFKDGRVTEHPWGMFTVPFVTRFSNLPKGNVTVWDAPSVTILTENPKVRTLTHFISVVVSDPQTFYGSNPDRMRIQDSGLASMEDLSVQSEIKRTVEKSIYDFNNAHSKELVGFFNPLEPDQQRAYRKLIHSYLDRPLAKEGLEISDASFNIR